MDDDKLIHVIHETVEVITNAFKNGKHVYFCGNGGSAADAQHLAAEFSGRFYTDRDALPAEALAEAGQPRVEKVHMPEENQVSKVSVS